MPIRQLRKSILKYDATRAFTLIQIVFDSPKTGQIAVRSPFNDELELYPYLVKIANRRQAKEERLQGLYG